MTQQDDPARHFADFQAVSVQDAVGYLTPLCSSRRWATRLAGGRPYADPAALAEASDALFADLAESDVDEALSGHPRIGERAEGSGKEASLSRAEQSSMQDADQAIATKILHGNQQYEEKFDRVFLIRAAGRTPESMLSELNRRLGNDAATELTEVREQLRQITRLRLEGAFGA